VGERNDIHPPNKQEVGRRLTLAAEALAYRDSKGVTEPRPLDARRSGGSIIVRFDRPVTVYGGGSILGVELCGDTQVSCRYSAARASAQQMIIAEDGQPVTRVRYAWADYPIVNLYGSERLPVPPFEMSLSR